MLKILFLILILPNVLSAEYLSVKVTAYPPLEKHTDSTPFITATNERVRAGGVAVSWDLEEQGFKPGCWVHIYGVGYRGGIFRINDRMGPDNYRALDVFFFKLQDAVNFGVMNDRAQLLWCG